MKKYDLHVHSVCSKCGLNTLSGILKKAKEKGLNGVAITDHNTIKGAAKAKKLNKDKSFEVIVGEEIMTDIGEVLAYYLKKEIKPGKFEDVIRQIKKQDAVCAIAHPYTFGLRKGIGNVFGVKEANAVETFNSRCLTSFENRRARKLAKRMRSAETGGSDAHFPWEIGKGYTLFEGNLRDAIKSKKTKSGGKSFFAATIVNRLLTFAIKSFRRLF